MAIEIKAPTLPESVPDGTIATWYKQEGESVSRDELLVDIETDKVLLEVVAPENGVLQKIQKGEGDTIVSNELLALFEAGDAPAKAPDKSEDKAEEKPAPVAEPVVDNSNVEVLMSPAAKKLVEENSLDANSIKGSGKDGRVTKEDVLQHLESASSSAEVSAPAAAPVSSSTTPQPVSDDRAEERVPMTRLRAKVAERLLQPTPPRCLPLSMK